MKLFPRLATLSTTVRSCYGQYNSSFAKCPLLTMLVMMLHCKLYEDEDIGVVDKNVESDLSSDHFTCKL